MCRICRLARSPYRTIKYAATIARSLYVDHRVCCYQSRIRLREPGYVATMAKSPYGPIVLVWKYEETYPNNINSIYFIHMSKIQVNYINNLYKIIVQINMAMSSNSGTTHEWVGFEPLCGSLTMHLELGKIQRTTEDARSTTSNSFGTVGKG